MPSRPSIAITIGDPLGIGPEITLKALADPAVAPLASFVVLASRTALERVAKRSLATLPVPWSIVPHAHWASAPRPSAPPPITLVDFDTDPALAPPLDPAAWRPAPTPWGGQASYAFLRAAIAALKADAVDALVTAPVAKEAWHAAGIFSPGHTEVLAEAFAPAPSPAPDAPPPPAMLFVGPSLRVILVTIHVGLARVPALITRKAVLDTIRQGHDACRMLGIARPRIAVAGLNPHAGEHGLFGSEDDAAIRPAVAEARSLGIDAVGPLPGDTVFRAAAAPPLGYAQFDLVVAMYHDQGLIPVKLADAERAVNLTVGLRHHDRRIIRTSPAHGTAFDIAARALEPAGGVASPVSMIESVRLAAQLSGQLAEQPASR